MTPESDTSSAPAGLPRPVRFLLLLAQLVGLAFVVRLWNIESTLFADLVSLSILGFAVHYWLPQAWRYRFFVGYSVACAFVMLGIKASCGLLLIGLVLLLLTAAARAAPATAAHAAARAAAHLVAEHLREEVEGIASAPLSTAAAAHAAAAEGEVKLLPAAAGEAAAGEAAAAAARRGVAVARGAVAGAASGAAKRRRQPPQQRRRARSHLERGARES